jgi:VanZ family protein
MGDPASPSCRQYFKNRLPGSGVLFYSWFMNLGKLPLSRKPVFRFLPALLMMLAIFLFSAGHAVETPNHLLGVIINKGGHMIGYGILALAVWRAFEFRRDRWWIAWMLAVIYALTDEFHQSFVPGRHPMLFDALFFDNLGALIALMVALFLFKSKQPGKKAPVVEDDILDANR